MSRCDKNLTLKYILMLNGKEREIYLYTRGWIPTITDYSFSYSDSCIDKGTNLLSLNGDSTFKISYKFEDIVDILFLFDDISTLKNKQSKEIINLVKSINPEIFKVPTQVSKHPSIYYVEQSFLNEVFRNDDNTHHPLITKDFLSMDNPTMYGASLDYGREFYEKTVTFLFKGILIPFSRYKDIKITRKYALECSVRMVYILSIVWRMLCLKDIAFYYNFVSIITDKILKGNMSIAKKKVTHLLRRVNWYIDEKITQDVADLFIEDILVFFQYTGYLLHLETEKIHKNVRKECSKLGTTEQFVEEFINKVKYIENMGKDYIYSEKVYVIDNIAKKSYFEV